MSDSLTKKMLRLYESKAPRTRFLTGFFQTPSENFHTSESVEIDIIRNDEDIATVIHDLSVDGNMNENSLYTNKEFIPPIFDEEFALNSFDMIKRQAGDNPFVQPNYMGNAARQLMRGTLKLEQMIGRAVEEMASQVLQTGTLVLKDKDGDNAFSMDFKPKATHFPTVATGWSTGTADIAGDINSLAEVIRNDGLVNPNILIMSDDSWFNFLKDDSIKQLADNRRIEHVFLSPDFRGNGQTYQGIFAVGNYRYEIFTYSGRYKDRSTSNKIKFMQDNKVIMLSGNPEETRLDLTFGAIPRIVEPDPRIARILPSSFGSTERGMRLSTYGEVAKNGKTISASVGTRPLTIPTAIDTFGCLTTEP